MLGQHMRAPADFLLLSQGLTLACQSCASSTVAQGTQSTDPALCWCSTWMQVSAMSSVSCRSYMPGVLEGYFQSHILLMLMICMRAGWLGKKAHKGVYTYARALN